MSHIFCNGLTINTAIEKFSDENEAPVNGVEKI